MTTSFKTAEPSTLHLAFLIPCFTFITFEAISYLLRLLSFPQYEDKSLQAGIFLFIAEAPAPIVLHGTSIFVD